MQLPRPPLFRELDAAQRFLEQIASKVHLLSPVVALDYIPEFHEISLRYVHVDPFVDNYGNSRSGDVYVQKGGGKRLSLTKRPLDAIAGAAGINWHPTLSGRLDNGLERFYVHFRAVGLYRDIDGSWRTISREKEIDLRDGNPNIFTDDPTRMRHAYDQQRKCYTDEIVNPGYVNGWSAERLAGAREHILSMCESKAKNRVIRDMGVKHTYTAEELQKPFAVMKLVMTGRSEDPELQREAKKAILRDALDKSRGMFGEPPSSRAMIEHDVTPKIEAHEAPPVGATKPPEEDDLEPDAGEPIDVTEFEPVCGCPQEREGIHRDNCDGFGPG